MVRMLSGVVNSAKTASRRVWCGALSLGTLPGHATWPRRHGLGYPAQARCGALPGAGWVRRYGLGSNSAAALGGMRHWLSLFCEVI